MNPQQSQQPISSKDLASNLGFANHLLEQQIPKDAPQQAQQPTQEPQQGPQNAPQQQQDPATELEALKTDIMKELVTIKEDIKMISQGEPKDEKSEIADLKKQIEDVLNSSD